MRSIANFHDSSLCSRGMEMIFLHGILVHDSAKFGILKRIQRENIYDIYYTVYTEVYITIDMIHSHILTLIYI